MKRLIPIIAMLFYVQLASANSEEGPALQNANVDLSDTASLQRGARTFVNYCVSCHSASYMRYNRIAKDLGIAEATVASNMMFTTTKIGDTMTVAMRPADAEAWFGVPPPDLSVVARSRGADWLYTFLQSFYLDGTRPTGVNNSAFPATAMPHVLWELQGLQKPVYESEKDVDGNETKVLEGLELEIPGKQDPSEYKKTIRDLVNFLVYLGEPAKLVRYRLGFWVIGFLCIFFVAAYLLKKEYWKDVH